MFWRRSHQVTDPLDQPILYWSPRDPYTTRNLLDGGLCIFGATGSGKTSSSAKTVGRAVVGMRNSCGLINIPKPEDAAMWRRIFAEAGRSADLLEFDADGSPLRCNFIAEAARHGSTREITRCITTIGETLRSNDQRSGEDASFWAQRAGKNDLQRGGSG